MSGDHVKPVWVGGDRSGNDLVAPDAYMLTGQAAQDYADGAALRRLREALPEGTHVALVEWPGEWNVGVMRDGSPPSPVMTATGDTIAEAADKCRMEQERMER